MSIYSPDSEVFGARALYAAVIVISAFTLFAAVASTIPAAPAGQTLASAAHAVQVAVDGSFGGPVS